MNCAIITPTRNNRIVSASNINIKKSIFPISFVIVVFSDFEKYLLIPTQICLENIERLHLIEINQKSKLNVKERYQKLEKCFKELVAQFIEENKDILLPEKYEVVNDEFIVG